jgi:hypothetical protein
MGELRCYQHNCFLCLIGLLFIDTSYAFANTRGPIVRLHAERASRVSSFQVTIHGLTYGTCVSMVARDSDDGPSSELEGALDFATDNAYRRCVREIPVHKIIYYQYKYLSHDDECRLEVWKQRGRPVLSLNGTQQKPASNSSTKMCIHDYMREC